jgi:hypothetical protein
VELLHRQGRKFVSYRRAEPGETLAADEPFPFAIGTAALPDFRGT